MGAAWDDFQSKYSFAPGGGVMPRAGGTSTQGPGSFYQNQQQGYQQLLQQVLGSIAGVGRSQGQAIEDTYAKEVGASKQDLMSRGLGNTTVIDSEKRGLLLDKSKAQIALQNQLAQLTAGYEGQIGSSQLQFQQGYEQQNRQFQQQQQLAQQNYGYQSQLAQQQNQYQKTPFGGYGGYGGVNSYAAASMKGPTGY